MDMQERNNRCGLALAACLMVLLLVGCGDEMTAATENKKGMDYYAAGNYEKAAEYYERALGLADAAPEMHNNLGMALIQLNQLQEAQREFDAVINPEAATSTEKRLNKYAYRGKGIAYMQQKDFESALQYFNKALEIDVEKDWNIDLYYYKANVLECMGYPTSAIENYTEVLNIDNKNEKALLSRANVYRLGGETKEAIADYEEALSYYEGSYAAYIGLYNCYMDNDQQDKAEDLLFRASLLTVKNNEDKYLLGQVHFYQKNYTAAEIEMKNAVDNGYAEANYFLGEIALANAEYEQALTYYEEYRMSTIVESPTVCNQEVVCYLALFDYDNAERMLKIGLQYEGSAAYQQLLRNEIALLEGKIELDQAYEKLKVYIVAYPDDNEAIQEYKFLKKRLGYDKES